MLVDHDNMLKIAEDKLNQLPIKIEGDITDLSDYVTSFKVWNKNLNITKKKYLI